ncbi:MAG: CBS domain-containing protein [Acidobacteriota bacterium]|nr:CBS domain-containing protein [Acidobacteriota bacterium]
MTVVPDIVEFLRRFPPFAELDPATVDALAEAVEVEFVARGATIFSEGAGPVGFLRVVRTGAVEVVHDGRVLDVMGPGEMFGHASMLSGLPTGFTARAGEDTLVYRIPESVAAEALSGPRGLRFVTRLLLEDRHHLGLGPAREAVRDPLRAPVGAALRGPPVLCGPGTPVREAARLMSEAGASALVVELADGVGIVTDTDLRRVVATGLSGDEPVSAVMSAPARTVPSDQSGGEVLLDMLDRGVRHFPVTSAAGRILGVVEDHDLVAAQSRTSFALRRAVARAGSIEELSAVALELRATVAALTRAGTPALEVMSVYSVVTDAMTRRTLDLVVAAQGEAPVRFAWMSLGSQARREALPCSDLDSALVWLDGPEDESDVRRYLGAVATSVSNAMVSFGFARDEHRVSAADPLFMRSLDSWRDEARLVIEDPMRDKALVIVSVLVDSRPVWGVETEPLIADLFRSAASRPILLRLLARFALSQRPPSGFRRGHVVDPSGEGRAGLDLKSSVVVPIVGLARWAGLSAGVTSATTTARLAAARDAGVLGVDDARSLQDAFELACQLRLDHQVAQIDAGVTPSDVVDPAALNPLARGYLKEAFRAVASVQSRIANEIAWSG